MVSSRNVKIWSCAFVNCAEKWLRYDRWRTLGVHSALRYRLKTWCIEFLIFDQSISIFCIPAAFIFAWLKRSLMSSLPEQDFLRGTRADSCCALFSIARLLVRTRVDFIEIDRKLWTVETNIFLCTARSFIVHHLYLVASDQIGVT